jgi:hypothetical protein
VCIFKVEGECFGRAVLQHDGDGAGQDGHVGRGRGISCSLGGCDAGEPGEGGQGNIGADQKRRERGGADEGHVAL